MSLKLSFILPCYNVERYVVDCLDSIYAQDMSEDEYEVICVNDCSTDGTRPILERLAQKHSNLVLIDHESNLSAGEARNTGIRLAKGEYIWFVDPDDMINPSCPPFLHGKAKDKNLDILLFNHEMVDETKRFLRVIKTFQDSELCDGQNYVVNYFPGHFSQLCIVWRCLFRTEFLRDFNLSFPAMNKAEDVSFLWKAILQAERVASVGEIGYTYRINPYSIGKKTLNASVVFSGRVLFAYEICNLINCKDLTMNPQIRQDMNNVLKWCFDSSIEALRKMSLEERKHYYDEIENNRSVIMTIKPYMNWKQKAVYSVWCGERLWLLKVDFLDCWKKKGSLGLC